MRLALGGAQRSAVLFGLSGLPDLRDVESRQTALNLENVGFFEPVHAPSGLGTISTVCFLPAYDQFERNPS